LRSILSRQPQRIETPSLLSRGSMGFDTPNLAGARTIPRREQLLKAHSVEPGALLVSFSPAGSMGRLPHGERNFPMEPAVKRGAGNEVSPGVRCINLFEPGSVGWYRRGEYGGSGFRLVVNRDSVAKIEDSNPFAPNATHSANRRRLCQAGWPASLPQASISLPAGSAPRRDYGAVMVQTPKIHPK